MSGNMPSHRLAAESKAPFSSALAVRRSDDLSAGAIGAAASGDPLRDQAEPYLTSLAKLFPAEALSALLLVLAIDERYAALRFGLIAVITLASGFLRYFSSRDPVTNKPDILAVFVSVVSFLIYAAALLAFGVLFHTDEATTRIVATVVAILWMAILTSAVRRAPRP